VAMETNPSFPSGHAMGATMGFGFLAYALCLGQTCRRRRLAIIAVLGALILGIGFSRIYLRAHWLSDVVGGFALGLAWLSVCIGFLERRPADKDLQLEAVKADALEIEPALSELVS